MTMSSLNVPKNFDCLLDSARSVLDHLVENAGFLSNYCLVGGSALSLYLCHRKSEDLDFFTYADTFDRTEILSTMRSFAKYEVLNDNSDQLDLLLNGVKVTFFNAKWAFLCPEAPARLNIATLSAIAAMKTNVLFMRAKYRDYYDLYFMAKKCMPLNDIFASAQPVISGLTYKLFCVALLYIDDIEDDSIDHLSPVEIITKRQIRDFFESLIRGQVFTINLR